MPKKYTCRSCVKIFQSISWCNRYISPSTTWLGSKHFMTWISAAKSLHIDWNPAGGLTPSCSEGSLTFVLFINLVLCFKEESSISIKLKKRPTIPSNLWNVRIYFVITFLKKRIFRKHSWKQYEPCFKGRIRQEQAPRV